MLSFLFLFFLQDIIMLTTEWGPYFWKTLHLVTKAYPETPSREHQRAAWSFIHSLQYLLPCFNCQTHFATLLKENPPNISSREAFIKWGIAAHNLVNERLGKTQIDLDDFNTVVESWKEEQSPSPTPTSTPLLWWAAVTTSAVVILIILVILLMKKKRTL